MSCQLLSGHTERMTSLELLDLQQKDALHQLQVVFQDITEELGDETVAGQMSPREMLIHLQECYFAWSEDVAGRSHEWGTYVPSGRTMGELFNVMADLRASAFRSVEDTKESLSRAHGYGLAQEYYHVGQMCTWRFNKTPDFDPVSIYS